MADISIPQPKKCSKCGEWFPATTEYFNRNRVTKDGLHSECKACRKAYNAEHKEEKRAYNQRWYAEHKEDTDARNARWRAEHKEEQRTYFARYYAEHKSEKREYDVRYYVEHRNELRQHAARYYAEHREKQRVYVALYRVKKPEVIKAAEQRRFARKRQLPNTLTAQEWRDCLTYFSNKCAYCGKEADFWTVIAAEHYIALKDPRADNPGTVVTNIIPACHGRKGVPAGTPCCNNNKGNKDPEQWLIERFGKRKAREIQKRIEAYFEVVKS